MILCIVGPTAVGKTKLSETLAVKYDAVIVNCDAMQVYKGMDIGTAKYTASEDLGQEHFLFDIVEPNENYTVYDYQRDLRRVLEQSKDRNVVIVGGTGLYLKAGLYNYEFSERETLTFDEYTNEDLYAMLLERGNVEGVHVNNRRRMISRLNANEHGNHKDELLYRDVLFIGLTTDRENLHVRINKRAEEQIRDGLLDEVKSLYENYGLSKAMKTGIGYKEVVAYFKGLMTLEETIELISRNTRRYAKRQYTWFKYQMDVTWFETDYENFDNTIDEVMGFVESKK